MKKIVLIVLLVFSALLFVGCDAEQASANKSNDKQNTEEYTSDYNKFINIDSSCGLDLFVYNDNGTDKCVLFSHKKIMEESYGTIIDALLESIQDSLDNHSLTIDEMKEVFKTYAEDDLHYIIIHIVDKKVNYDDLKYNNIVDAKLTKRTEVANKLGLNISSELEGILLHPVFSSGVIYAKVGNELNISFDVFPTDYVYKNVYIKSSDESIVTIDNTCKASFISEGNAQIIFSIDGILEYYPVLVRNDDIDIITLPDEIKNISQDDLVFMSGFHSMISSYIFHSTNQDLLKYVLDLSLSIEYNEVLTNENRDPVAEYQDMQVSIQLAGDRSLNLTLTTESNIYLQYFVKENDEIVAKYEFKAYKPKQYKTLTAFCKMGMPSNHWWCETPACTQYYTGNYPIDEYMQETIVKTFIDHKSPLSNFYKNGTKFSGFIRKSFGKFNGYYAVIVDGCGLCYYDAFTDVIVDGVKFTYSDSNQMYLIRVGGVLSLQEAFEKEIISHDDLVEISKRLNKSYDDKLVIDGTYYGKLCYTNPGLSSLRVDRLFEISNAKLSINDKELKIEECEYDGHFFDNLDLALSYSLDYRQMFEYPNKGWFALLDSSETKKGGYSILISKFNTIYIFETVFDLKNDTYYIHAIYKLINQVEQTNVISSLFVDKYYFGMLLYVQPNLLSTREATSMTFQDDELIIGDNKYKLEEKIFDECFIKIDDDKLNNLFGFPSKGLIARIDDASYYCIIEGNDGIVYCLECAAINSEFYECDTLCAYLLVKKIKLDDSFMYRTVDDKCDSKNIAEASKVNLIQVDMTFEEVVEILGKPVAALGSDAIWYEWSLDNDTILQIQFTPKGMEDVTLYVLRIVVKE